MLRPVHVNSSQTARWHPQNQLPACSHIPLHPCYILGELGPRRFWHARVNICNICVYIYMYNIHIHIYILYNICIYIYITRVYIYKYRIIYTLYTFIYTHTPIINIYNYKLSKTIYIYIHLLAVTFDISFHEHPRYVSVWS